MNPLDYYRELLEAVESSRESYQVTLIGSSGSTPRKPGAKMLVFGNADSFGTVGGGDVEHKVIERVLVERPREPKLYEYSLNENDRGPDDPNMSCGGRMSFFVEPLTIPHQLYILGGGHCSMELSRMASRVEFAVTVIDNRAEWADSAKHPAAVRTICSAYDEIEKHIRFSPDTYIVIMTHGHDHDESALRLCLGHEFKFLGVIGSRRKSAAMFDRMSKDGFSAELLSRVQCPVGIPIPTHTPSEIAVSIVASLINQRNSPNPL